MIDQPVNRFFVFLSPALWEVGPVYLVLPNGSGKVVDLEPRPTSGSGNYGADQISASTLESFVTQWQAYFFNLELNLVSVEMAEYVEW